MRLMTERLLPAGMHLARSCQSLPPLPGLGLRDALRRKRKGALPEGRGAQAAQRGARQKDDAEAGHPMGHLTYLRGEVAHQVRLKPIQMKPLPRPRRFHLYCSPHDDGALAVGEELQAGVAALKERGAPLAAEAQEELKGLADAVVENLEDVEVEDLQKALQVGRVAVFVCEAGGARVCCETRADGRCMHAVRVDLRPRTSLAS